MHPVSTIIDVAEARSRELIAEAAREKLAEQAINTSMHAAPEHRVSPTYALAVSLAIVMAIAFIVLVANASLGAGPQTVAIGP